MVSEHTLLRFQSGNNIIEKHFKVQNKVFVGIAIFSFMFSAVAKCSVP